MKLSLALAGVLALVTSGALARQANIIKERAKELNNQNNVRQGVAPPTQAVNPASGTPVPAPPKVSASLVKFQTDLAAISAGSTVTAAQKQQLASDLIAGAQGAKPSLAMATRLADGVSAAAVEKPLSEANRSRLVRELDAVLNPGKYPQAKLDGIYNDVQAIFQDNGLNRTKASAISDSVKAISGEIAQGGAK
jgi:hypothetical protein